MTRYWTRIYGIILSASLGISVATADVVLQPLHAGLAVEYGQLKGLTFFEPGGNSENYTVNRTIGWIFQGAMIDERMDVNLALGGMFFQFFPFNKGFDYSKVRNSAVSIGQAAAKYKFGDIADPSLSISFGLMPYKYNPDSRNLGEYLFRSTPYPSTTINGSWDLINSSYTSTKGVLIEKDLFENKWKNDFIISLTDEVFPLNDINLAYVTSFQLGLLDIGAGVNFNNILPNSPALSTPEKKFNSYFTHNGVVYSGDDLYYKQAGKFFAGSAKKLRDAKSATAADSIEANRLDLIDTSYIVKGNLVDSINKADTVGALNRPKRDYYTFKGTLLMGRASLNLGSLISDKFDLKLYSEVDVLGWTNYPIFYENRSERMPLMAGITLPTFGLLDNLAIEMEYWKNRYPIINYKTLQNGLPIVNYDAMNSPAKSIDITVPFTADDFKWSISSKKSIGKYFSVDAQIANDHTRPIRFDFSPYKYDTMLDSKAWYYILRLQINM
jgi:hypothetical protein